MSVESYVTNVLLPVTGTLHGRQKAFGRTVRETEHHDVVRSGTFADEFRDKLPREWTKQALITLEVATEAYMVEVTAEFHC